MNGLDMRYAEWGQDLTRQKSKAFSGIGLCGAFEIVLGDRRFSVAGMLIGDGAIYISAKGIDGALGADRFIRLPEVDAVSIIGTDFRLGATPGEIRVYKNTTVKTEGFRPMGGYIWQDGKLSGNVEHAYVKTFIHKEETYVKLTVSNNMLNDADKNGTYYPLKGKDMLPPIDKSGDGTWYLPIAR